MNKTTEEFINAAFSEISKKTGVSTSRMFVVWYAKELQNHKALVSFKGQAEDPSIGDYIEVTYNGDKKETYYDYYYKKINVKVTDNENS